MKNPDFPKFIESLPSVPRENELKSRPLNEEDREEMFSWMRKHRHLAQSPKWIDNNIYRLRRAARLLTEYDGYSARMVMVVDKKRNPRFAMAFKLSWC
jgi:hypothetical protein